jgi:hypothetical protein
MSDASVHGTMESRDDARGASGESRRRITLVLATIVIFPLLVVVAYFSTRTVLPEVAGIKFSLPQNNASVASVHSFNFTSLQQAKDQVFPSLNLPSLPNLPQVNLADLLLVLALAVVAVIVFRGFVSRREGTTPFEGEADLLAERRRKAAEILDAAAARLGSGSSYRETVIQCYKLISDLLEEKSDLNGKVLTAREFKKRVSEKLKIDTPYLSQLTELFEVARYSEREITKEQAEEAAVCLSNISAPLKQDAILASDIN